MKTFFCIPLLIVSNASLMATPLRRTTSLVVRAIQRAQPSVFARPMSSKNNAGANSSFDRYFDSLPDSKLRERSGMIAKLIVLERLQLESKDKALEAEKELCLWDLKQMLPQEPHRFVVADLLKKICDQQRQAKDYLDIVRLVELADPALIHQKKD